MIAPDYSGYLEPAIPTILLMASLGIRHQDIAGAVIHKIVEPPWWWNRYDTQWRLNALKGNITNYLVKYGPAKACAPKPTVQVLKPLRRITRPLDMGGPRDVWLTWTPYTNAIELGLLR